MLKGLTRTTGSSFHCRHKNRGFGFIEVMVSLVFVLIIGGLVIRFAADIESEEEANLRQAREGVMLINSAIAAYMFDLERAAPGLSDGGLQALVDAGYIQAVPQDPWGKIYQYKIPAQRSGRVFDLYSLGPDGVISIDDIADWELYSTVFVAPDA